MNQYKIISVDFQNDFSAEGGKYFRAPRPSTHFIKDTLVPFVRERGLVIAEIISDYRPPRLADSGDCCHPGEWGYESEIPADIKDPNVWIKSMNSPIWVRENGGEPDKLPGAPYQDTEGFTRWLNETVGNPAGVEIVLIGLTLDCCVLSAAQELSWRGYKVKILAEGTDVSTGVLAEKKYLLSHRPLLYWADAITWAEFQQSFS